MCVSQRACCGAPTQTGEAGLAKQLRDQAGARAHLAVVDRVVQRQVDRLPHAGEAVQVQVALLRVVPKHEEVDRGHRAAPSDLRFLVRHAAIAAHGLIRARRRIGCKTNRSCHGQLRRARWGGGGRGEPIEVAVSGSPKSAMMHDV